MPRFTLTMTRNDGRSLTEELFHRTQVRDLTAAVLSALTFRPDHEFLDFAIQVAIYDGRGTITHAETGVMFELTENTEN